MTPVPLLGVSWLGIHACQLWYLKWPDAREEGNAEASSCKICLFENDLFHKSTDTQQR